MPIDAVILASLIATVWAVLFHHADEIVARAHPPPAPGSRHGVRRPVRRAVARAPRPGRPPG